MTLSWNKRSWHHQWSHLSLLDFTLHFSCFLLLFFVVFSGMMHRSKWPLQSLTWKEKHTLFGKIPVKSIRGFVARRRNHRHVYYSQISTGGWLFSEVCFFLIGVLTPLHPHFLIQAFGWRFRCLRINYFNLSHSHRHPHAPSSHTSASAATFKASSPLLKPWAF